jgi:hypothetical protein
MRKKICICLTALSCIVSRNNYAQVWSYLTDINSQVATIPYIFEGQVTSVEVYAGDDVGTKLPYSAAQWNGDIGYFFDPAGNEAKGFALTKIRVCKVYKGEGRIRGGTEIEVLTKSFAINNVYLKRTGSGADADTVVEFLNTPASHSEGDYPIQLPHNSYPKKLYFWDRFDPINPSDYANVEYHSNMHSILEMPFNQPVYIPQSDGSFKYKIAYCAIVPYAFDDQTQLQAFLDQIQTINSHPEDFCSDGTIIHPVKNEEPNPIITSDNRKRAEQFMANVELKRQYAIKNKASSGNKASSTNDIYLNLVNERIVNISGSNWFEFDVYASTNQTSLYFDNVVMRFGYNTAVFGSSVQTNNNIVITRAAPFVSTTYKDPNTILWDFSSSDVTVPFGTDIAQNPLTRVQLSSTPSAFLTIRMKIQSGGCNLPMNVAFNSTTLSILSQFATSASQSWSLVGNYDNTTYTGNVTDNSCQPIITNFTTGQPDGQHKTVTITGKYFGNAKRNGAAVIFKNADKGNRYPVLTGVNGGGIQAIDLISWNHNQIVTVLPGCIDSAYYFNAGNPIPVYEEAIHSGSGKFKVVNYAGGSAESATPIDIPHGVQTWPFQYLVGSNFVYTKIYAKLVNMSAGGYRILVNNRINTQWGSNPTGKAILKKGMRDWTCATAINWYLGGDTTLKYQSDAWCVVDTANMSALMQTISNVRTCLDGGVQRHWLRSFDIKIKTNPTSGGWQLDTSGAISSGNYDWYSAISHELGHGHQVNHINDSIVDLMWWQGNPFGYPTFLSRKTVKGSYEARAAGNFVTDSCLANYSGTGCVAVHTTTYFGNCDGFDTKVKVYGLNAFNVEVFPNPSKMTENIKIKCYLLKQSNVIVTMFDITGKRVLYDYLGNVFTLEHELKTSDLNQGVYLLQVEIDRTRQSFKIIKE